VEEADQTPLYCAWEDLHWADPSTLEILTLFLDQVPTTRTLALLTFRPEFTPPWGARSYLTPLMLRRLDRPQVEMMVENIAGGKALPAAVLQQIVAKTDGVPLFVEELSKTVVESGLVAAVGDHYELSAPLPALAIPATLHDSLMARLDRLAPVREIAQIGAVLGREFSYELLHAVSHLDEGSLQQGLRQLMEAELLYQRGLPPRATYLFKHALVQDTAYQSLLKSTRQQYHQQIAQALAERFPDIKETQPELLAHHYTEASLLAQAIPYWQQAGQRAAQRSAHVEAVHHLSQGLELLKRLPDTPERAQQELMCQVALGSAFIVTKGYAAPEVESAYTRARELCQQSGEPAQLFPVLVGLHRFYQARGDFQSARELGEQCLTLAQHVDDPILLVEAHRTMGTTLYLVGEFTPARAHLERSIALHDPQRYRSLASSYVLNSGVSCLSYVAWTLWFLGYPEQAVQRSQEAIALAHALSHPFSLSIALVFAAVFHPLRREEQLTREQAEAGLTLSTAQGFVPSLAVGMTLRGWALAEQGQGEEGIGQMRQGIATWRATGAEVQVTYFLALLAEAYGKVGQAEEGLTVLSEAVALVHKTGERHYEAELYRLKGTLTLQSQASLGQVSSKSQASHNTSADSNIQHPTPSTQAEAEAEACFHKAIEISRRQQAKSLELRAVMSLARLRRHQGKAKEARLLLAEIYHWFTEGFDTKDLQEAKALLDKLP
jgi:predicted ATPase